MVETLTTWVVVLSIFIVVLGVLTLWVWLSDGGVSTRGDCKNCGGSGQTVVQGTGGNIQIRCPVCGSD